MNEVRCYIQFWYFTDKIFNNDLLLIFLQKVKSKKTKQCSLSLKLPQVCPYAFSMTVELRTML